MDNFETCKTEGYDRSPEEEFQRRFHVDIINVELLHNQYCNVVLISTWGIVWQIETIIFTLGLYFISEICSRDVMKGVLNGIIVHGTKKVREDI